MTTPVEFGLTTVTITSESLHIEVAVPDQALVGELLPFLVRRVANLDHPTSPSLEALAIASTTSS